MIITKPRGQRLNHRVVLYRFHWALKTVYAWVAKDQILAVVGEDKHYKIPPRPVCPMDTFEWIVHCILNDNATEVTADEFLLLTGGL